jgi:GT2 family glycosyltransferase
VTGPETSVVVCAFTTRRWEQLTEAVHSVLNQSHEPREVLVVIDHNDELLRMAQSTWGTSSPSRAGPDATERVRVLASQHVRGLSGARNTGLEAAMGEVVAFLDDDAHAEHEWLTELTRPFADPAVVGTGGRVLPLWDGGRPTWFPAEFNWVVGCSYVGLPTRTTQVRNPIGASMAFRRETALQAGGFSTDLGRIGSRPSGCEETELSIRMSSTAPGRRIIYAPDSVVHHHVSPDRSRWSYFARRCWAEGLSKARVASRAGRVSGLQSERAYVRSTLPRGIALNLADAARSRRSAPLARAVATGTGLAITTLGYAIGTARERETSTGESSSGPASSSPSAQPAHHQSRFSTHRDPKGEVRHGQLDSGPAPALRHPRATRHQGRCRSAHGPPATDHAGLLRDPGAGGS